MLGKALYMAQQWLVYVASQTHLEPILMSHSLKKNFLKAWTNGKVCLHPSDTIPGLTFNPEISLAKEELTRIKGRDINKPFIGLVSNFEQSKLLWSPLPKGIPEVLKALWPGPLSVIWKANPSGLRMETMISPSKEIALRWPIWPITVSWLRDVIDDLKSPFPTTSVNKSGDKPILLWNEAVKFAMKEEIYSPELPPQNKDEKCLTPSTVIRITNTSKGYETLRVGAYSEILIEQQFSLRLRSTRGK